nr:hypothetical protein [Pseudomonadales bacterium]
MNKIKQRLTAVAAGSAIAAAGLFAPQAMAAGSTEMELRILQMEESLRMMRSELEVVRSVRSETGRFDALEERVGAVETADMPFGRVFFRSGFQNNNQDRAGEILVDASHDTSGALTLNDTGGDEQGWYFGAGIEHGLSRDLFGLMDDTWFMGEITINYSDHGQKNLLRAPLATAANDATNGTVLCAAGGVLSTPLGSGPYGNCSNTVSVTQLKITASPKIRFNGLKDALFGFQPWIIPGGFTINVISPPSDGVTVTAPGVQFGAGADMALLGNITVGFEGIYNM